MARAEANPLRILDSKRADWQDMIERAPQIGEYLTDEAAAALRDGAGGLAGARHRSSRSRPGSCAASTTTPARRSSSQSDALDAAQNAIGGGGRYDGLVEEMGGQPTPGIGFGIGIERVLIACDAEGVFGAPAPRVDVFVVDVVGGTAGLVLIEELRAAGLRADRAYGGRAFRKQMAAADKSGARYGVILGAKEMAEGKVGVKDLTSGDQIDVRRDEAAAYLQTRLESR